MHIYLKHDIHGAKVAINEEEAKADERNGWVRFDPTVKQEETSNTLRIKRAYTKRQE